MTKYQPQTKSRLKQLVKNETINLGEIDTSYIEDMSELFWGSERKDFSGIETWNVSNVADMNHMFKETRTFNGNISNWDVSKVENMEYMFRGAKNFNNNISNWDISNVRNSVASAHHFNAKKSKEEETKIVRKRR